MTRFTTFADAVDYVIAAITAVSDGAEDYDVDAIASLAFEYRVDTDDRGQELLNTAGFELIADDEIFWWVVAAHKF